MVPEEVLKTPQNFYLANNIMETTCYMFLPELHNSIYKLTVELKSLMATCIYSVPLLIRSTVQLPPLKVTALTHCLDF